MLSTASAYKFPQSVYKAITGKSVKDAFTACDKLFNESAFPIPDALISLKNAIVRFNEVADKASVEEYVLKFING